MADKNLPSRSDKINVSDYSLSRIQANLTRALDAILTFLTAVFAYDTKTKALTVTPATTFSGAVTVTGNETVTGTLGVTGLTTLSGGLNVSGGESVYTGNFVVTNGTAQVGGGITQGSRTLLGNFVFAIPAGASGPTRIDASLMQMPFNGSFAAISSQCLGSAVTAGNYTVTAYVNGGATAAALTVTTGNAAGNISFTPGATGWLTNQYIYLSVSGSAAYAPAQNITVTFWGYI